MYMKCSCSYRRLTLDVLGWKKGREKGGSLKNLELLFYSRLRCIERCVNFFHYNGIMERIEIVAAFSYVYWLLLQF